MTTRDEMRAAWEAYGEARVRWENAARRAEGLLQELGKAADRLAETGYDEIADYDEMRKA